MSCYVRPKCLQNSELIFGFKSLYRSCGCLQRLSCKVHLDAGHVCSVNRGSFETVAANLRSPNLISCDGLTSSDFFFVFVFMGKPQLIQRKSIHPSDLWDFSRKIGLWLPAAAGERRAEARGGSTPKRECVWSRSLSTHTTLRHIQPHAQGVR